MIIFRPYPLPLGSGTHSTNIIRVEIKISTITNRFLGKDTRSSPQSTLSKYKPNCIAVQSFQPYLPTNKQEISQCIQWKVCSGTGPRRSFLSCCMVVISFHFLLQSSEFYWPFGLVFDCGNSIFSGVNLWCPWTIIKFIPCVTIKDMTRGKLCRSL